MSAHPSDKNEQYDPAGDGLYPDRLTTHDYDGIQEYDNPMPMWWKAIFLATVVWAVFYVGAIELGYINTYEDSLAEEFAVAKEAEIARMGDLPPLTEDDILTAMVDPAMAARGEKVFESQCGASCHGVKGEGYIGPNLTDHYWIYEGTKMSIYESIANGRANGMPAWGNILGREDTLAVSAYVETLRGKNLDGPKGEEGDYFNPEASAEDAPAGEEPAEGSAERPAEVEPAAEEPAAEPENDEVAQ